MYAACPNCARELEGLVEVRLIWSVLARCIRREDISGSAAAVTIHDPCLLREPRLAVILGAEGDGLSPDTIRSGDYTVRIPMSHGVDSLNVAAASAVAFWELARPVRDGQDG